MGTGFTVWHIIGSMRAVDKWSSTAQANIGNSTRVGYKQADVSFGGGGGTSIMNNPTMKALGHQVAEQVMTVFGSSIDWRQGELISSPSDTSFAVNGQGFFMLTEGIPSATNTKVFYTRNGQFHKDGATGRLVNDQGLFYVSRDDAQTMGLLAATSSTTLTAAGAVGDTTITVADANAARIALNTYIQIGNDIFKVSNVSGNTVTFSPPLNAPAPINTTVGNPHAIAMPNNLSGLMYSKYGSTVFEDSSNASSTKIVDLPENSGLGQVLHKTLEASNVNLSKQITSLTESKNVYTGLSKTLTVFFQNFEIGLNLLK